VIQGLEVALRNAVHNVMTSGIDSPDWYDKIQIEESERDAIDEAKKKISDKHLQITPGRVVAELTFGFWVKLLAWPYEKQLWVKFLYRAFPSKMKRKTLHGRLVNLKTLRNRIAHHERIIGKRNLPDDYRDLLEAIGWIDSTVSRWVQSTNCFEMRYAKRLKAGKATAIILCNHPKS